MDASSSVSAGVDDEATRKSTRLKGKPRLDVVKLLSLQLPAPKVTPDDRRRLAQMRADAAQASNADERLPMTRPTVSIVVGSEKQKREITVYPCRVCDFLGRTAQSAKSHEMKAHPAKRRCKVCHKYLHSQIELETHCLEIHQATALAIKCEACDFVAPDQETLDAHTEYEHYSGAKRNEYCHEMVDGSRCPARFVQIKELRQHLASVHGLAAALDTVQEEFASWEEFMRWKAQFELETRSVYKIGYGRRHGNRRYMCVRSGRYKPVPEESRQRRPRENRTIKLGFNCTATMTCKFPDTGGVRVVVHPFHYGHKAGDMRLPGMKPEGAPDDWIRPDTRKIKKKKPEKDFRIDVIKVETDKGPDNDTDEGEASFPVLTEGGGECRLSEDDPESAAAVAAITIASVDTVNADASPNAAPPDGPNASAAGPAAAAEPGAGDSGGGGDVAKSSDEAGTGGGGGGGDADTVMARTSADDDTEVGNGGVHPSSASGDGHAVVHEDKNPDIARTSTPRIRKPGPRSKCGPPLSPEPEPDLEPEPEVRRGPFGRRLPPAQRPGPGSRYKKLLRRAKTLRSLRNQLGIQLTRLSEARELQAKLKPSAPGAAPKSGTGGGSVASSLEGTPLENVSEIDETPAPLAVLRAEPGDLDLLPDVVFPEMDLLTAPTDLQDATETIFDLKMEVMSLRARLVRRAAVETALRADALDASARHLAAEQELRAELEKTRTGLGSEAHRLRRLLGSVFSQAQILALEDPEATVPWAPEDYEQAIALRWTCSRQAFDFVRNGLKVPLPSMAAVRATASNGRPRHVADAYLELVRVKTLEGDAVGDEDGHPEGPMEVRMVLDGPEQTVEVATGTETTTTETVDPADRPDRRIRRIRRSTEPVDPADRPIVRGEKTPTAHDHGFSSALAPAVLRRRRRQRINLCTGIRLCAGEAGGLVTATLRPADEASDAPWPETPGAAQDRPANMGVEDDVPTVVMGQFGEGVAAPEFIGPDVAESSDERELSIAIVSSGESSPSKRARY